MKKSEAIWVNIIATCCRLPQSHAEVRMELGVQLTRTPQQVLWLRELSAVRFARRPVRHPKGDVEVMYSMSKLAIRGHQGEELPNTFFGQDGPSDHLAIVLPGLGYTVHMPVLYYPTRCLLSRGADVLWVQYDYTNLSPQDIKQPGWRRRFGEDVDAAYEAGLAQRSYSGLSLVGKSLGTVAIAHLLARGSASQDPRLAEARCVWLTPLLRDEWIREQISRAAQRSLAIIGTADPQYEPDLLARCGLTKGAGSLEIPNANHSLEIERDVPGSVRAMEQMVLTLEAFLQIQQGLEHA